ncbi:hypothetical protein D3C75_910580 [compost metagenome]
MNVMMKAHADTRSYMVERSDKSYREVFAAMLKNAHWHYKQEVKQMNAEKEFAIKHFEDVITKTLVHFEKLGVNDYYVAIENNAKLNDYTLLAHKVEGDTNSPLGWAAYANAIVTTGKQADEYVKAYPGVCKLHAQTYLSKVLDNFRDLLAQAQK